MPRDTTSTREVPFLDVYGSMTAAGPGISESSRFKTGCTSRLTVAPHAATSGT